MRQGPTVIETPEGPIPIPVAFPQNAPPLTIPHLPGAYVWTDVVAYTANLAHSLWDRVFGGTETIANSVRDYVDNAISAIQTSWSSFVQWNYMFTLTVFDDLTQTLDILQSFTIENVAQLGQDILGIEDWIANAGWVTAGWVFGELAGLEQWVVQGIDQAVNDLKTWVWDDVVNPAITELQRALDNLRTETWAGIDAAVGELEGLINEETLARALAIAGLWAAVQAITDFVDSCGEPMCESFGPNTNLGKWLKALEGLFGLLAGFELAGLTEEQLAHFAQVFASISGQDLQSLLVGFTEQGATIGQAAAGVLGDITDVGTVVLHDLGIPVP